MECYGRSGLVSLLQRAAAKQTKGDKTHVVQRLYDLTHIIILLLSQKVPEQANSSTTLFFLAAFRNASIFRYGLSLYWTDDAVYGPSTQPQCGSTKT